jgi:hypothetical protein
MVLAPNASVLGHSGRLIYSSIVEHQSWRSSFSAALRKRFRYYPRSMATTHDQTDPDFLNDLNEGSVGLGLFLLKDISSTGQPMLRVRSVSGITYPQSHGLAGLVAFAFKWIPDSKIASLEGQSGERCSGLCVSQCLKIPCWCIDGTCRRFEITGSVSQPG